MNTTRRRFLSLGLWRDEKGQDMIEYALLGSFVAVAVAALIPRATGDLTTVFSKVGSVLIKARDSTESN